jgi:hypothetical protein
MYIIRAHSIYIYIYYYETIYIQNITFSPTLCFRCTRPTVTRGFVLLTGVQGQLRVQALRQAGVQVLPQVADHSRKGIRQFQEKNARIVLGMLHYCSRNDT